MNEIQAVERQLKLMNYADNTYKNYLGHFKAFYYSKYYSNPITRENVLNYLVYKKDMGSSLSAQNQIINTIKFYLEKVLKKDREVYYIDRPKSEKRLPTVLNKTEIKALFAQVRNIKHKAILRLIYGCGLRVGELTRIEIRDIDSTRKLMHIG